MFKLKSSSLAAKVASGTFWILIGTVISSGSSLLASFFLARILGQVGMGEYGILINTANMFVIFATFGLGVTTTKHVAEFLEKNPERAGRIVGMTLTMAILMGGCVSAGVTVMAPVLAEQAMGAAHLTRYLYIIAIGLGISAVASVPSAILTGLQLFKWVGFNAAIGGVFTAGAIITGAMQYGVEGAITGYVCGQGVNLILNSICALIYMPRFGLSINLRGCWSERRLLVTYSLPSVFSSMMLSPVHWLCNSMLAHEPNGYAKLGIFHAANQWSAAVMFLPHLMGKASLPLLSNQERFDKKAMNHIILLNLIPVTVVVLGIIVFSQYIMKGYGPNFVEGWPVLCLIVLAYGLTASVAPLGNLIAARNKQWMGFLLNLIWACLYIGMTYLYKGEGAIGLAQALLIAYVIHTLNMILYSLTRLYR